jgi:hypothetical protein
VLLVVTKFCVDEELVWGAEGTFPDFCSNDDIYIKLKFKVFK